MAVSKKGRPHFLIIAILGLVGIGTLVVVFGVFGLRGNQDDKDSKIAPVSQEAAAVQTPSPNASDPVPIEDTPEAPNDTTDEAPGEEESPEAPEPASGRDNSSAQLTTLFSGSFAVGSDIPAGRYVITATGSGNFFVYDKGFPIVNEILDDGSLFMDIGVPSVTADLKEGQEIEISGLSEVVFTPAQTSLSNVLTTGTWVVGLDIAPGKYDATCEDGQSGNFFVYKGSFPVVNEILDKSGMGLGVEKVRVSLEDGQVVVISSLKSVTFENV